MNNDSITTRNLQDSNILSEFIHETFDDSLNNNDFLVHDQIDENDHSILLHHSNLTCNNNIEMNSLYSSYDQILPYNDTINDEIPQNQPITSQIYRSYEDIQSFHKLYKITLHKKKTKTLMTYNDKNYECYKLNIIVGYCCKVKNYSKYS